MSEIKKTGPPGIEEDAFYQRRFFIVQKAGWALMCALIAASVLGYAGEGLLGKGKAGGEGELRAEYPGFGRVRSDMALTLHAGPELFKGGTLRLWADKDYLRAFQILEISPRPALEAYDGGRVVYVFHVDRAAPYAEIKFLLEPRGPGRLRAAFGSGAETIEFRQFVYP